MRVLAEPKKPSPLGRVYTLDLLLRAIGRLALWQALSLVYRIARARLCGEHHVVYRRAADALAQQPGLDIADFVVQSVRSWPAMKQLLQTELRTWPRQIMPDDPQALWQEGSHFWIGRLQGQAATIAVARAGQQVQAYFFPLPSEHTLLSHCGTFPSFRGRGLYPAMLTQIARHLATKGVTHVVIHCADWNTPSRRGIERAGFHPIGTGIKRRDGRLQWLALPGTAEKPAPAAVSQTAPGHSEEAIPFASSSVGRNRDR
jgi:RimJ/RimL family protein N-acetyltransferase